MDISRINLIYFSPTGGTKFVGEYIAQSIAGGVELAMYDITVNNAGLANRKFSSDELAVFCFPVFGGRIPAPVAERLEHISATQTPAVIIVVYGNRAYDDALLEAKSLTEKLGFKTIAAGAFISEHSVIRSFGKGRPDEADIKAEKDFAEAVLEKLNGAAENLVSIQFNDKASYKKYSGIPLKPRAGSKCVHCGLCAQNCPVHAICVDNPSKTDKAKCISCMRCLNICPNSARKLNPTLLAFATVVMKKYCSARKRPEMFI